MRTSRIVALIALFSLCQGAIANDTALTEEYLLGKWHLVTSASEGIVTLHPTGNYEMTVRTGDTRAVEIGRWRVVNSMLIQYVVASGPGDVMTEVDQEDLDNTRSFEISNTLADSLNYFDNAAQAKGSATRVARQIELSDL